MLLHVDTSTDPVSKYLKHGHNPSQTHIESLIWAEKFVRLCLPLMMVLTLAYTIPFLPQVSDQSAKVYMFLQKGCHGQRHSLAYMRVNLNLF